jgi:hypothetical protein
MKKVPRQSRHLPYTNIVDPLSIQSSQKRDRENLGARAMDIPLIKSFMAAMPPVP